MQSFRWNIIKPQVIGSNTRNPFAPALVQSVASSLMLASRSCRDGWTWSKTQLFRCFQIIQGVSRVIVANPLRINGQNYDEYEHITIVSLYVTSAWQQICGVMDELLEYGSTYMMPFNSKLVPRKIYDPT